MPEFKPFKGLRYDEEVVGSIDLVVAPPYDVINTAQVLDLQSQSQYNVTHLTRPQAEESYAVARACFDEWKRSGALKEDIAPAFYIYRQVFNDPDTGLAVPERIGIVGLLKLEDYSTGNVLPHENTLNAARADRLNLLRASHANFESIYGLYSDTHGTLADILQAAMQNENILASVGEAIGSSHHLYRLDEPEAVSVVEDHLKSVPVFIADGHHRYETSLAFSKERPDISGSDYILVTLTALEDPGLLVLPTHRLLRGFGPGEIEILPARLMENGFFVEANTLKDHEIAPHRFVLTLPSTEYIVTLPGNADLDTKISGDQSRAWKSLDVSILHTLIVGDILGIPLDKLSSTDKIAYTRDADEARRKVKSGEAQAAVIMARPTVDQMRTVSEAGDKMPQKSTFFYPKLLSGLVMYDMTLKTE
jgi:uncharacterized protein (DUF1015 family)